MKIVLNILRKFFLSMFCCASIALNAVTYVGTYLYPERSITSYSGPAAYQSQAGVFARPELAYLTDDQNNNNRSSNVRIKIGYTWARKVKFDILKTIENINRQIQNNPSFYPGFTLTKTDAPQGSDEKWLFKLCLDKNKFLPGLDERIWGAQHIGDVVVDGNRVCCQLNYDIQD